MASTKRKWTKEEEDILVQAVQANPHNLSQCFRELSKKIDRSESGIMYHWYKVLGNPKHPKHVDTKFITIGRNSSYSNRKNWITAAGYTPIVKPKKQKVTLWSKIKLLLGF